MKYTYTKEYTFSMRERCNLWQFAFFSLELKHIKNIFCISPCCALPAVWVHDIDYELINKYQLSIVHRHFHPAIFLSDTLFIYYYHSIDYNKYLIDEIKFTWVNIYLDSYYQNYIFFVNDSFNTKRIDKNIFAELLKIVNNPTYHILIKQQLLKLGRAIDLIMNLNENNNLFIDNNLL